ncbi:MAG: hypothetical protein RR642_05705 [Solibacillus sp.]
MKFHFEYKPYTFKKYVKENFAKVNLLPYPDYEKEAFKSSLVRLLGQADVKVHEPIDQFNSWLKLLDIKYKQLLPFIYKELLTDQQRASTILEMSQIVKEKKIVFAHLLHQCYSENEFVPYWTLLVRGYKSNPEIYNKFWSSEIKIAWNEYVGVSKDHVAFVGKKILERLNNMDAVLDLYFIREEHAFYREIFFYIYEHGTIELYRREEKRFREALKAADTNIAQRLATGFVRANAMDEFEDISYMIFDKLNTYIKRPMYWDLTDPDVKEKFHQWYLRKNIEDFFSGVSQNHERFVYWEKFIARMKDALVLEDRKTILFYFADVVIMEILGTGAVYVYELDTFEIHFGDKVNRYREGLDSEYYQRRKVSPYRLERKMIMNKNLVYKDGWLTHSGGWQDNFDRYLKRALSWEV